MSCSLTLGEAQRDRFSRRCACSIRRLLTTLHRSVYRAAQGPAGARDGRLRLQVVWCQVSAGAARPAGPRGHAGHGRCDPLPAGDRAIDQARGLLARSHEGKPAGQVG
jgi:hypothetical protein